MEIAEWINALPDYQPRANSRCHACLPCSKVWSWLKSTQSRKKPGFGDRVNHAIVDFAFHRASLVSIFKFKYLWHIGIGLEYLHGLSMASKATLFSMVQGTSTFAPDLNGHFEQHPNGRHTRNTHIAYGTSTSG